jgi:hypothetical protein
LFNASGSQQYEQSNKLIVGEIVKSEEKWQREGDNTGSWSRKTLANLVSLSELSNKKSCIANKEIQVPLSKQ